MSLILLAPSWGGMINGVMTLSGAWQKLRHDPILRFLVVSLSFYGMSTFEGPMMAIKTVNALSHNTDWTIGHVHSGALGWVAMVSIGAIYHLLPKVYDLSGMYSLRLINLHFWLATIGVVLYIAAMWVNGIMQGLDVACGQRGQHPHLRLYRLYFRQLRRLCRATIRRHSVCHWHDRHGLQRL